MHNLERLDLDMPELQSGVFIDLDQLNAWKARDTFCKNILESATYFERYTGQSIHRHGLAGAMIERADIVQPNHMVIVFVGEQNSVQVLYLMTEHLLTEIRASVNQYIGMAIGHQCSRAKAIVQWIGRRAYEAIAANNGNALRCACAK